MSPTYKYPRPALTVDCALFGLANRKLHVLLIQRKDPPFQGQWALPGGFVEMEEPLRQAALRELAEETGVANVDIEQLHTFGAIGRDPRDRTVSVVYFALVRRDDHPIRAASDARTVKWFTFDDLPPLAFDHDRIVQVARARLRTDARTRPIGLSVLPARFLFRQLRELYEVILGRPVSPYRLRAKVVRSGLLVPADEPGRPAASRRGQRYCFDRQCYQRLVREGWPLASEQP